MIRTPERRRFASAATPRMSAVSPIGTNTTSGSRISSKISAAIVAVPAGTWLPQSASLLNKMDHAFWSLIDYGGAVITEAGTDPTVAGLVYIAAHMPDAGENEADDGKRFPSDLSKSNAIKKTADGFTYIDPAQFHEYFAADLSAEQAAFMARSQVLNLADNFKAVITTAAWRSTPSWMLVATKDRTINPDLERWYAERAKSHKVEVAGASHSVTS